MTLKRNVVANLLGRTYSMASVYLFVPFYVATLGIERYGIVAFYAILLTIAALADVGLSATLAREAAREPDRGRLRDLLATMERILLTTALVFAVVVILGAEGVAGYWLNGGEVVRSSDIATSLRLMALMIVPQLGISLYTAGLLGLERQATANILQAAFVTIRGGLVIPLLYLQPSLQLFFGWQLGVTVVFFLITRAILLRGMGFGALTLGQASLKSLRPVMAFAGGMFAITVLAAINTQMDKLVVSKMFSIAEFSYYSLASTLAQLPSVVVGPLLVAMLPRLTRMVADGDEAGASALFARFCRMVAVLSGVGATGLFFFAPEVLALWLGADHVADAAVTVVRILSLGGLFLALGSTPFYLGLAHGHNRTSIVIGVGTLALAIPLLLLASARFGLIGAAWPWVLINLSSFVALTLIVTRRYYRGSVAILMARSTVGPLVICVTALALARTMADALEASPATACAIAAVASVAAVVGTSATEIRNEITRRRLAAAA